MAHSEVAVVGRSLRPRGWYWVKIDNVWQPGLYDPTGETPYVQIIGSDQQITDLKYPDIGPPIVEESATVGRLLDQVAKLDVDLSTSRSNCTQLRAEVRMLRGDKPTHLRGTAHPPSS